MNPQKHPSGADMSSDPTRKKTVPGSKNDLLTALLLFSVLFWIAALTKPYHVDEFYSWRYVQQCSANEILSMKDTGIGHPPTYHLLQKAVQTLLPDFPIVKMRLVNYIIGLLLILVISRFMQRFGYHRHLFWGLATSGALLNATVFSRMFALVTLAAFVIVMRGEIYLETRRLNDFLIFLICGFLGLLADFNIVILAPYIGYVLFSGTRLQKPLVYLFWALILPLWLTTGLKYGELWDRGDIFWSIFKLFTMITEQCFLVAEMMLGFWFFEPVLICLLVVGFLVLQEFRQQAVTAEGLSGSKKFFGQFFALFLLLVAGHVIFEMDFLRGVLLTGMLILGIIYLFWRKINFGKLDFSTVNMRLILPISAAIIIVAAINPLFWRPLTQARFYLVLMPLVLLLFANNLGRRPLTALAFFLGLSGLMFSVSNGIGSIYPAGKIKSDSVVVYENTAAYAGQYLFSDNQAAENPYILNTENFIKSCRVCSLGTSVIPFETFQEFSLIAYRGFPQAGLDRFDFAKDFEIISSEDVSLNILDKFWFRFLTPVFKKGFVRYNFQRKITGEEAFKLKSLVVP